MINFMLLDANYIVHDSTLKMSSYKSYITLSDLQNSSAAAIKQEPADDLPEDSINNRIDSSNNHSPCSEVQLSIPEFPALGTKRRKLASENRLGKIFNRPQHKLKRKKSCITDTLINTIDPRKDVHSSHIHESGVVPTKIAEKAYRGVSNRQKQSTLAIDVDKSACINRNEIPSGTKEIEIELSLPIYDYDNLRSKIQSENGMVKIRGIVQDQGNTGTDKDQIEENQDWGYCNQFVVQSSMGVVYVPTEYTSGSITNVDASSQPVHVLEQANANHTDVTGSKIANCNNTYADKGRFNVTDNEDSIDTNREKCTTASHSKDEAGDGHLVDGKVINDMLAIVKNAPKPSDGSCSEDKSRNREMKNNPLKVKYNCSRKKHSQVKVEKSNNCPVKQSSDGVRDNCTDGKGYHTGMKGNLIPIGDGGTEVELGINCIASNQDCIQFKGDSRQGSDNGCNTEDVCTDVERDEDTWHEPDGEKTFDSETDMNQPSDSEKHDATASTPLLEMRYCKLCGVVLTKEQIAYGREELNIIVCRPCGKKYLHKNTLNKTGVMKKAGFQCDRCHEVFARLADFKCHQLVHESQYQHQCLVCQRRFRQPVGSQHNLIHIREKDHCLWNSRMSKAEIIRDAIKGEMKKIGSTFACQVCGKKCSSKRGVIKHRLFYVHIKFQNWMLEI